MGDIGNAASGGGSTSLAGADTSNLFSDASLGDQLTGGSGDIFGGSSDISGGGGDLSNLFADAGLSSALLGDSSGLGGVFSTATDPSGSAAASLSTNTPADTAGTPSGSDPSGNIGGTQSGGAAQPNAPQPQPAPAAAKQPPSPLAQIAKMVGGAFGLGAKPTAGGPTAPTPQQPQPGGGDQRGGEGLLSQLLPTMPVPANTGELPPGGYAAPSGQGGIGSDAAASASQTDDPAAKAAAEGGVATPQPAIPIGGGPGNALEAPTGAPAQPPAAVAKPAPAPTPAPAAPAPAPADLPTKKGTGAPATPEAPPGAPEGQGAPTEGMGEILRDVLGLALGSPTLLPMLAQMMMGGRGRGRGGIPPWAMHGMTPFMRGRGRGFGGYRGGFLRPGYYPRRQGGWGFHPGGYHPGWGAWAPGQAGNQPMAFGGGGGSSGGGGASGGWEGANTQSGGAPNSSAGDAGSTDANGVASSSNPFLSTLLGQESGGRNIVSNTDKDDSGRTLAQGGNPNQISQGYFQIKPSTWRIYAARAGVDPNMLPRQADYATQWKVASVIPAGQWGPDTKRLLAGKFGAIDWKQPLGQVASRFGGTQIAGGGAKPASSSPSRGAPGTPPANIRISDPDNPIHDYPAKTETGGAPAPPPVQSDDYATTG
jgi:hypothetical protein